MADVAKVAGVSHQTVSRVLNDFPKIRPSTRDRVLAAIEELGYRRNTDRFSAQRLGQIALAVTLNLTVKLVKWAKRWTD